MTGTCVYVIYLWQWLYFWFLPRPCAFKLLSHLFFCLFFLIDFPPLIYFCLRPSFPHSPFITSISSVFRVRSLFVFTVFVVHFFSFPRWPLLILLPSLLLSSSVPSSFSNFLSKLPFSSLLSSFSFLLLVLPSYILFSLFFTPPSPPLLSHLIRFPSSLTSAPIFPVSLSHLFISHPAKGTADLPCPVPTRPPSGKKSMAASQFLSLVPECETTGAEQAVSTPILNNNEKLSTSFGFSSTKPEEPRYGNIEEMREDNNTVLTLDGKSCFALEESCHVVDPSSSFPMSFSTEA